MDIERNSIYVELDDQGIILYLKSTLLDCSINEKNFIGKNWFDTFIETSDREKVLVVFKGLFGTQTKEWKTYKNDIKCDNSYRLIDFTNNIVDRDGKQIICSMGIEHIYNS